MGHSVYQILAIDWPLISLNNWLCMILDSHLWGSDIFCIPITIDCTFESSCSRQLASSQPSLCVCRFLKINWTVSTSCFWPANLISMFQKNTGANHWASRFGLGLVKICNDSGVGTLWPEFVCHTLALGHSKNFLQSSLYIAHHPPVRVLWCQNHFSPLRKALSKGPDTSSPGWIL